MSWPWSDRSVPVFFSCCSKFNCAMYEELCTWKRIVLFTEFSVYMYLPHMHRHGEPWPCHICFKIRMITTLLTCSQHMNWTKLICEHQCEQPYWNTCLRTNQVLELGLDSFGIWCNRSLSFSTCNNDYHDVNILQSLFTTGQCTRFLQNTTPAVYLQVLYYVYDTMNTLTW